MPPKTKPSSEPSPTASTKDTTAASSPTAASKENRCLVYCRVRPRLPADNAGASESAAAAAEDWITVKGGDIVANGKAYQFDGAFESTTRQDAVYKTAAEPCVRHALEGFRASVVAYGQTGSGKTFTLCNRGIVPAAGATGLERTESLKPGTAPTVDVTQLGVIPRAAEALFQQIGAEATTREYHVEVEFVEIYRDQIRDLLNRNATADPDGGDQIILQFDAQSGVTLGGAERRVVTSANELCNAFEEGFKRRVTAKTQMNPASSRGHVALLIWIMSKGIAGDGTQNEDDDMIGQRVGKLTIVDLAGYEQLTKTGIATGPALQGALGSVAPGAAPIRFHEAKTINASLLALGQVVRALGSRGAGHVPWRDSKLTRLLQDSIGGRNRTTIILTISPSGRHVHETTNTLQFGTAAMGVKVSAHKEEVVDYRKLATRLQGLLDTREGRIGELEARLTLLQAQRDDLCERHERELEGLQATHDAEIQALQAAGVTNDQIAKVEAQYQVEQDNLLEQHMQERASEAERREEIALQTARQEALQTARKSAAESTDLLARLHFLEQALRESQAENERLSACLQANQGNAAGTTEGEENPDYLQNDAQKEAADAAPAVQRHFDPEAMFNASNTFGNLHALMDDGETNLDPSAVRAALQWCRRERDALAEAAVTLKMELNKQAELAMERGMELDRLREAGASSPARGTASYLAGCDDETTQVLNTARNYVGKVDVALLDAAKAEIAALQAELTLLKQAPPQMFVDEQFLEGAGSPNQTWRPSVGSINAEVPQNLTPIATPRPDANVPSLVPKLQLQLGGHAAAIQALTSARVPAGGQDLGGTFRNAGGFFTARTAAGNYTARGGQKTARGTASAALRVKELEAINAELIDRCSLMEEELATAVEALQVAAETQDQAPPPPPPVAMAEPPAKQPEVEGDTTTAEAGQPKKSTPPNMPPSCGITLPPGWDVAWTSAGEQYYVDHTTQRTVWQLPSNVLFDMYAPIGAEPVQPQKRRRPTNDSKRGAMPCTNWARTGTCWFGDSCAFKHS